MTSILGLSAPIAEFKKLESLYGIGSTIRARIEKRFKDENLQLSPSENNNVSPHSLEPPLTIVNGDNPNIEEHSQSTPNGGNKAAVTSKRKERKSKPLIKKDYVPAFRSGPYAMLIALYVDFKSSNTKGYLFRHEIAQTGQQYCSSPIEEGSPVSPLQGAIKTLTAKGIVTKSGVPSRFVLTDIGIGLAERLWNSGERRSSIPLSPNHNDKREEGVEQAASTFEPVASIDSYDSFKMRHDQYDIILLVDTREVRRKDERNFFVNRLSDMGIKCEQRAMELGDFLWVARSKDGQNAPDEVLLDYVIERKRESDMIASITDGRGIEQRFRLFASNIRNKIYLIEKSDDADFNSIGQARFDAAIMQTQIIDGFFLRYTGGMEESIKFLSSLHQMIVLKHHGQDIFAGTMGFPVYRKKYFAHLERLEQSTGHLHYQSYGCYTQLNHKSANLTVRDIFVKQLLCIKHLTLEKATQIVESFPTLISLFKHYLFTLRTLEERENYFKDWTVTSSKRKFGAALSKRICDLITASTCHYTDIIT